MDIQDNSNSGGATLTVKQIAGKLTSNILIYGLGTAFSRFIVFLLLPIYTRVLSPAEYGTVDVLLTFNSILLLVAVLGIDSGIALIFQTGDIHHQRRIITSSLIFQVSWSVVLVIILLFFSQPISRLLLNDTSPVGLVHLAFLILPAQSILNFAQNLHKWKQEPLRFGVITIGLTTVMAIATIWFVVKLGYGASGVLLGTLLANVIFAVVGLIFISPHLVRGFALSDVRSSLALGLPFVLAGIAQLLLPNINRVFLVNLVGIEQTGVYAAGLKLSYVVLFTNSVFMLAYGPYFVSIQHEVHAPTVYKFVSRSYALLLLIVAAGMTVFARPLIELILGKNQFVEAYPLIMPLCFGFWFAGLRTTFDMGLVVARKTTSVIWVYGLAAIISIPMNWLLIRIWGTQGGAWATALVEVFLTATLFYANQRVYPVDYEIKPVIRLAFLFTIFGLFISWMPVLSPVTDLVARGMLMLMFLGFSLFYTNAIRRSELQKFYQLIYGILRSPVKN